VPIGYAQIAGAIMPIKRAHYFTIKYTVILTRQPCPYLFLYFKSLNRRTSKVTSIKGQV